MAAQNGNAVLLNYGQQGAQQVGSAVLLNYDAQVATGARLVAHSTQSPWVRSRGQMVPIGSRHAATGETNHVRKAPWGPADTLPVGTVAAWPAIARADGGERAPWPAFGVTAKPERVSSWRSSARRDDSRSLVWTRYGDMLNEDRYGVWRGSKPADHMRLNPWGSHRIKVYIPVPYLRPDGTQANFVVVGGAPHPAMQLLGTLANMRSPVEAQFGSATYAAHFFGDPTRRYFPPIGKSAGFFIDLNTARKLAVDEAGNPLLAPSSRDTVRLNPWGKGKKTDRERLVAWNKYSRPMNPGWGIVVPGGPTEPTPGESIIIPVQRAYIVINDVLLTRASDSTVIHASQLSVSFDCDSWLPTFNATIDEKSRDAVMPDPTPVEVVAFINGVEFRFFVEKVTRNRQFAQRSVTVSGRGIACELDAPYAARTQHTNATAMNAQQLIDAALQYTTYTQTWGITDWLVSAGALSLQGTPADVAAAVAEASGSVLAADWALRDLRMLPRYPVKPWDWATATPDYVIPAAVTQTESLEWIEKPAYNTVYVSGVQQGVIGQVKITGTAGDKPAPMVTNPLITHADAARQRGISILGDTGRKAIMQISMPVLPATGVIDVCRLIEFSDGANTRRGIVRANSVSANWPTVRQTLTIEAAA